jgi:hypothetical protein
VEQQGCRIRKLWWRWWHSCSRAASLGLAELYVATVRSQVQLSLFTDFENFTKFKPAPFQEKSANTMLDEVIAWGDALKALRIKKDSSIQ